MSQSRRRIGITGLGPITAFGIGIDPLWSAMCEGKSAIKRISRFDPSSFPCQIAAELPDDAFRVRDIVPKSYRKATKVMARDIELAVGAAAAAVTDAGLTTKATDAEATPTIPPERFGCHIGAGLIAADVDELTAALVTSKNEQGEFDLSHWGSTGIQNLTPLWLLKYLPNMLACHVTIVHDCRGPSNTITCAETSAVLSIGESMRAIERGAADACLSGGAEFKINPMGMLRQIFAKRLADTNGSVDPTQVVKPYDSKASGSVLGEGGGILVVEALDCAEKRIARIYAEITGFAATQSHCPDTVGVTIESNGEAIADAIELALQTAKTKPDDIDAIAPFASSIPSIDEAESAAFHRIFGKRASEIPLITTIPNVGNCCAGASAIPVAVASKAIQKQQLPARLNTTSVETLNANASTSSTARLKNILVVSTGMGGQNAALILQHPN